MRDGYSLLLTCCLSASTAIGLSFVVGCTIFFEIQHLSTELDNEMAIFKSNSDVIHKEMLQLESGLSELQSRSLRQVSSYYIAPESPTTSPSPPSISPPPNYKEFLAYFPSLDSNKNFDYYDQQPFEVPQKTTTTSTTMPFYKHKIGTKSCEKLAKSCPAGLPGPQGAKGEPGMDGVDGEPGVPGQDALDIYQSPQQYVGCFHCPAGEPGIVGPKGLMGVRGKKGRPGIAGQPGQDGAPGQPGEIGSLGSLGASGKIGMPGEAGKNRVVQLGMPGLKGLPGLGGLPGPTGDPGLNGYSEFAGLLGQTGPQGLKGPPGRSGAPGAIGVPGYPGQDATYCHCPFRTRTEYLNSNSYKSKKA